MAEYHENLPIERFGIRLSARDPNDVLLSKLMADDLADRSVNLSAVVKSLLLSWYQQRMATGEIAVPHASMLNFASIGFNPGESVSAGSSEYREDPDDELVRRMAGISFDQI